MDNFSNFYDVLRHVCKVNYTSENSLGIR